MTRFPRPDYGTLHLYQRDRNPVPVDLSDNTNRWGAHPAALAAVRSADEDTLTRYPEAYARDLSSAIQRRFDLPADAITTGCGSDDILDSTFRAAGPPGGTVYFAGPTFSMVAVLARMNGCTAVEVPWSRVLADPGRLLENKPDVVYVCRPNNPTGLQAPRTWLDTLLGATSSTGPLIVLDEAYADFAGESLVSQAPAHPRLLVVRTLSKAYGLAGLRVGFAVGSPEVAREVEKSRGPYKVSRIAARAAVAALDDADGWVARTIAQCVTNRERLSEALQGRGFSPLPSLGNFVFFPVAEGSALAWNRALRHHGVAVRPFSDLHEAGDGLRVSVAPWPLLERFLAALDRVIEKGIEQGEVLIPTKSAVASAEASG